MAKARSEDMQSELQRLERLQNATRPDARPESIISQLNSVAPLFLVGMAPCGALVYKGMTGRSLGALKVALGGLGLCVAHGASTLLFDKNLG